MGLCDMKNSNNIFNSIINKGLELFVPKHIKDPRLIIRMIRSRDPSAWFAVSMFVFGILTIPWDMIFSVFERRLIDNSIEPDLPIIIICGVPRSGTTLVSQAVIKYLPVSYLSNLTALFPRSPIIANTLFRKFLNKKISFSSYYGKTVHLSGPNDAFFIWNRWLKEDSSGIKCVLREEKADEMTQFFGAFQREFGKPLILKNNSLNTQAAPIASALPNSYFICMTRDPIYVAQSLINARKEIQGNLNDALWVDDPDKSGIQDGNYVEDVCNQVLYHEKKIAEQQKLIGAERFRIVRYEDFIEDPNVLLKEICDEILKIEFNPEEPLRPFPNANKIQVSDNEFSKIARTIDEMKKIIN